MTAQRAFALVAISIMLVAGLAPHASAEVIQKDTETRAHALEEAVARLQREPGPASVAAVRAALDDAPPALRSSPILRDIDDALTMLEDPTVATVLLPMLQGGALSDPSRLDDLPDPDELLERLRADIGFDQALLASEFAALNDSVGALDLSDPELAAASLRAMPEEELETFLLNLATFTSRWNATGGTPLAASMDALARKLAARAPAEYQGDVAADAAITADFQAALDVMAEIRASWGVTMGADEAGVLTPEEQAQWSAWTQDVRDDAAALVAKDGLDQDAFAGMDFATQWPYTQTAGPVAIDGVPISPPPAPALASALPPAQETQPETRGLSATDDQGQISVVTKSHRERANELRLPGTYAAGFPWDEWVAAADAEAGTDAPGVPFGGFIPFGQQDPAFAEAYWQVYPHLEDTGGELGGGDTSDFYRIRLPQDHFVRLFLEVPAGTNADMQLFCEMNGRTWDSASDDSSTRQYFDSITFLNNAGASATGPYHGSATEAFAEPGEAACPNGAFFLHVYAQTDPGDAFAYLLRGNVTKYDAHRCLTTACRGLDWVKWGDHCKEPVVDASCVANRPGDGLSRNDKPWSALGGPKSHPVVFVHGVGASYHSWANIESDGYYPGGVYKGPTGSASAGAEPGYFESLNMESVSRYRREAMEWTVFAAGMIVYMTSLFAFTRAMTYSFSLAGILTGITVALILINVAAMMAMTLVILVKDVVLRWRAGSSDLGSHFWGVRAEGFETYWIEYNSDDNNARHGQIEFASRQLKFAVSAIQQDFYDRHKAESGFPYASPEDVTVNFVVHSNGGLVTRMYMVDETRLPERTFATQTYSSAIYEADVNKWISLQTPNMGSSPARLGKTLVDKLEASPGNIITALVIGISISLAFGNVITMMGLIWILVKVAISTAVKAWAASKIRTFIDQRDELIRGDPGIVKDFINRRPPAPDVDHGIIYGDPLQGSLVGLGRFDILVSEKDARGPEQLLARMATQVIHDDHGSSLFSEPARRHMLRWLNNPDDQRLTRVAPDPVPPIIGMSAGALGLAALAEAGGSAQVGAEAAERSLLTDFGQRTSKDGDAAPGARYVPDSGASSLPAPAPFRASGVSDVTQKLERLAMKKGIIEGAVLGAQVGEATRGLGDAMARNATPEEIEARQAEAGQVFAQARRSPGAMTQARSMAADVAVLRSGHVVEATRLLEIIGEPSVEMDPSASALQLERRAVLLVPTGGLSGLDRDAYFPGTISTFLARGGHVVVLAQERGGDHATLPGDLDGFGYAEESGAYADSVAFGAFSGALAGQDDATPDVYADGTFARWPENATVHLVHAKNGRPVALSYPWGAGTISVAQLPADWALATGRGTHADVAFVRDLLSHLRDPDAAAWGAPGAPTTVALAPGEAAMAASSLTLVLVDDMGRELRREDGVAPSASLTWTLPADVTAARHHEVDVLLRDADGNSTGRIHAAATGYAAPFVADPQGFRPVLADVSLDVTGADRVEKDGALALHVVAMNRGDAPRALRLEWVFPEHARAAGASSLWDAAFVQRDDVTIPAASSHALTVRLPAALRTDALVVRATADGETLSDARRGFTVYEPNVLVTATPDRAVAGSGDTVVVRVLAREASAGAAAPVALAATLRSPSGLRLAVQAATATPGGPPVDVAFTLPEAAVLGTYNVAVEARRNGERVGGGAASFRVPGQQIVAKAILPDAFQAGVASPVGYDVRNTGQEAITGATFALRLLDAVGAVAWNGSVPFTLAPGESARLNFSVTPQNAALGTHRLAFEAALGEATFVGSTPLPSSVAVAVLHSQPTYRVRDVLHTEARVQNTGRFVLALSAALSTEAGLTEVSRSLTLAPGARDALVLEGQLPGTLTAGAHGVNLTLTTAGSARTYARAFSVPAARVSLAVPTPVATVARGETLSSNLTNAGGVDARVPWSVELVDASGLAIVTQSGVADVPAGGSRPLDLTVPAQAARGAYRLIVGAEAAIGRAAVAQRAFEVDGVAATLDVTAPASGAPGAVVDVGALAGSATMEGGTLLLEALRPVPLPAWRGVANVAGVEDMLSFAGSTWLGTADGLVRVEADGTQTRFNRTHGLPADRVTALAARAGILYVGTQDGLAWRLPDGSFANATAIPGAPARDVTALAATASVLLVGTSGGLATFDGSAFGPIVGFPEETVVSLGIEGVEAWAAVATVRGSFSGEDLLPVQKTGTSRATPSIAVARNGDAWIAYVDNTTSATSIQLAHVTAKGALLGVTEVARGPAGRADPDVKVDGAGRVHVAWYDTVGGTGDVYYRRFSASGAPLGDALAVTQAPVNQKFPKLAVAPDDSVWVAWQDDREPSNPPGSIINRGDELYAARIGSDGAVVLPETRLTTLSGFVLRPVVATDADGNLHAAWTDAIRRCIDNDPNACWPNLETGYGKWAPDGSQLVSPMIASDEDDHLSWLPALSVDAHGRAHLAFQDAQYLGTELSYSRVNDDGTVSPRGVQLTTGRLSPKTPDLVARADGRIDLAWTDYRSGKEQAYHNVYDPTRGAFAGSDARINGEATTTSYSIARSIRIAASPRGTLHAAWSDERSPERPTFRIAVFDQDLIGHGVAGVDVATGQASRLTEGHGIPDDDVVALAMDARTLAVLHPGLLTLRDRASGATQTLAVDADATDVALRNGAALVAAPGGATRIDLATAGVEDLPAGAPAVPLRMAAAPDGLLVAGAGTVRLALDDRDDVVWSRALAPTPQATQAAQLQLPAEAGRLVVRGTLLSETGQRLARDATSLHVLPEGLSLAFTPPATPARPGGASELLLVAGNRGSDPLRNVHVTLLAGAEVVLDEITSLDPGEARTFTVTLHASRSFDVDASATASRLGGPVEVPDLAVTVRDHVLVAAPALTARLLAPDVATREPFEVGALLSNGGLTDARVLVSLDGGTPRAVVVPARAQVSVPHLATRTALDDVTLRLSVTGDASAFAQRTVLAGERVRIAAVEGASGPAGERVLVVRLQNLGPRESAFPLQAGAGAFEAAVPAQGEAVVDVPIDVAPGVSTLRLVTPWETRDVRLVGAADAVPLLSIHAIATSGGTATADVVTQNAGPGPLRGTLELDYGWRTATVAIDLPEGQTHRASPGVPLTDAAPGAATLTARFVRAGEVVATATRAFEVPGPILAFRSAPADRTALPGDAVTLAYVVENVADVAGLARVELRLGAAESLVREIHLAPGERANVTFEARIDADATDAVLDAVATGPGASSTSRVTVQGARVEVPAPAAPAPAAVGAPLAIAVPVTNPTAAPLDVVVAGRYAGQQASVALTVPAGGALDASLPFEATEAGEVAWTVALPSGRVLAEGATRVLLDTLSGSGVRVTTSKEAAPAGGVVDVTVTTALEGRVDLLGPGFRDAFVLNGTTTRTYAIPASIPAGRFTVGWNFDATNASGSVPLAIVGHEVRAGPLTVDRALASPGEALVASWTIDSALAGRLRLRTWFEDSSGAIDGASLSFRDVPAGESIQGMTLSLPAMEPGPARLFARMALASPEGDEVALATSSVSFTIQGVALRDLAAEYDGAGEIAVRAAYVSGGPADVDSVLRAPTATIPDAFTADGAVTRAFAVPAPEAGTYRVRLDAVASQTRMARELDVRVPGTGTPPVTTLDLAGPQALRADGLLVIAPTTALTLVATDVGVGVGGTTLRANGGERPVDGPLFLDPGLYQLAYWSWDLVGNQEDEHTLTLLVDGEAPTLAVHEPTPGSVQVGSALGVPGPTWPVLTIPAPLLPDEDEDGYADADEAFEGSDPADAASTPARWMPSAPPALERPVLVVAALRVRANATDAGAGLARLFVLVDGVERAWTDQPEADLTIDLTADRPGHHEVAVVAVDALGHANETTFAILLAPGMDGLLAMDPTDPGLPPFAREAVSWAQANAEAGPRELGAYLERRQAQLEALGLQVQREHVEPNTPPVVKELPGHLQDQLAAIQDALRRIEECDCLV